MGNKNPVMSTVAETSVDYPLNVSHEMSPLHFASVDMTFQIFPTQQLVYTSFIFYLCNMGEAVYISLYKQLKQDIFSGKYADGALLPSENVLASQHSITRTTARQALDTLLKEGYITKHKGKGSIVTRNRRSLGILSVKGLTEVAGNKKVISEMLQPPHYAEWNDDFSFPVNEADSRCICFKRLRSIGQCPVMLEVTQFAGEHTRGIIDMPFANGSFFETLNKNFHIGISGAHQNVKAIAADAELAERFGLSKGTPMLRIDIKFKTDKGFCLYSRLWCDTRYYEVESAT